MIWHTILAFRVTAPRPAIIVHPDTLPPLPMAPVARFLELTKPIPGLSRRARRRRRGERNAILRELAQPDGPTVSTLERRRRAALARAGIGEASA